jgi:hypothetical protein
VRLASTLAAQSRNICVHQEVLGLSRGVDLTREPRNGIILGHGR